jgi:hypothetical protein
MEVVDECDVEQVPALVDVGELLVAVETQSHATSSCPSGF